MARRVLFVVVALVIVALGAGIAQLNDEGASASGPTTSTPGLVLEPDLDAGQGLEPSGTEVPLITDPEEGLHDLIGTLEGAEVFTVFLRLVAAAGLEDEADADPAGLTVFAPTDDWFAESGTDVDALLADPVGLERRLRRQILKGALLVADFKVVRAHPQPTLDLGTAIIDNPGNGNHDWTLDGVPIVVQMLRLSAESTVPDAGIQGTNGVIHPFTALLPAR